LQFSLKIQFKNCNDFVMVWSKFLTIPPNSSQLRRKRYIICLAQEYEML